MAAVGITVEDWYYNIKDKYIVVLMCFYSYFRTYGSRGNYHAYSWRRTGTCVCLLLLQVNIIFYQIILKFDETRC